MPSRVEQDVARGAAQALAAKYGAKLPSLTDDVIARGPPPTPGSASRTGMEVGVGLIQIAGLVVSVAHLAVATYHASKDRSAVVKSIKEKMTAPAGMTGQQADEIVNAVVTQVEMKNNS
jgi:hypothetical protein